RRVDALQLRDPGRHRDLPRHRGGGAPVRPRKPRGVAAALGDRGRRRSSHRRPRPRRLPAGARAPAVGGMSGRESRLERLQAVLAAESLDAAIVTNLANVRYLTGYAGSNGLVLVTGAGAV